MFVERELLRRHWSPVARSLVIAMPITMALLALAAKALFPELELGRGLPARRRCWLADRPGGHLGGRDLAARAPRRPPHAQPRVRAQRRPGAALRPLLPRPRPPGGDAGTEAREAGRRGGCSARRSASASASSAGACTTACPAAGMTARYEGIYAIGFALVGLRPRRRHDRQRPDRRLRLRDRDGRRPSTTSPRASSSSPRTPARSSRSSPSSSSAR